MSRGTIRLRECEARTPPPVGIGAWADKLRQAAFDSVRDADITEIMRGLVEQAKKGDLNAAKFVLGYFTGSGVPRPQVVVGIRSGKIARDDYDDDDQITLSPPRPPEIDLIRGELAAVDAEVLARKNGHQGGRRNGSH